MESRNNYANETLQTIIQRRSIRSFTTEPVTDESIRLLVEAANSAPSAHNKQSWRFLVIREEKKRELVQLINGKTNEFSKNSAVLLRMAARSIASAPVVIGVVNSGELIEQGKTLFDVASSQAYDFLRTMEIQSSAAAVQNLLLAATSIGLSTVWLGILFLIKDEIRQFLGEPKGEFMAVIPVGYANKIPRGPEKRPAEMIINYLD